MNIMVEFLNYRSLEQLRDGTLELLEYGSNTQSLADKLDIANLSIDYAQLAGKQLQSLPIRQEALKENPDPTMQQQLVMEQGVSKVIINQVAEFRTASIAELLHNVDDFLNAETIESEYRQTDPAIADALQKVRATLEENGHLPPRNEADMQAVTANMQDFMQEHYIALKERAVRKVNEGEYPSLLHDNATYEKTDENKKEQPEQDIKTAPSRSETNERIQQNNEILGYDPSKDPDLPDLTPYVTEQDKSFNQSEEQTVIPSSVHTERQSVQGRGA